MTLRIHKTHLRTCYSNTPQKELKISKNNTNAHFLYHPFKGKTFYVIVY